MNKEVSGVRGLWVLPAAALLIVGCGGELSEGKGEVSREVAIVELAGAPLQSLTPTHLETIHGGAQGGAHVFEIEQDSNGNTVAMFAYNGPGATLGGQSLPFGGELYTGHSGLAKLRPDGSVIWAKGFRQIYFSVMSLDGEGNIYVGGLIGEGVDGPYPDVNVGGANLLPGDFLAKFSPAGTHLWSRNTRPESGTNFIFRDFESHPQGGFVALAQRNGRGPWGELMLIRYGGDGTPLWTRIYNETDPRQGAVVGKSLAVDAFGQVYVAGYVSGNVSLGGVPYSVPEQSPDFPQQAPLVAGFGPTGAVRWSRKLAEFGSAVAIDAREGHLAVAAWGTLGGEAIPGYSYLLSFDLSGTLRWKQNLGTQQDENVSAWHFPLVPLALGPRKELTVVVEGEAPEALIGGRPSSPPAFYAAKFDRVQGQLLAIRQFTAQPSPSVPPPRHPALPSDLAIREGTGEAVISGSLSYPIDFGVGSPQSPGIQDGFLLTLSP